MLSAIEARNKLNFKNHLISQFQKQPFTAVTKNFAKFTAKFFSTVAVLQLAAKAAKKNKKKKFHSSCFSGTTEALLQRCS